MADKEGLISAELTKNDQKNSSEIVNDKPSTSLSPPRKAESGKTSADPDQDAKAGKNAETATPVETSPTPPAPSLYQKFVSSFDAVIQNIVSEEETPRQILSRFDIDGIGAYIKEELPRNVIFMVGAGISTSAGIPDFRSPGTGLYNNLEKFNLPDPQAVFDISFFRQNPEPFYVLAKDLFHENIKPTMSHYLIRLFEMKGILRRCFTQNIDALEYSAGVNKDRVVAAHGSHQTSTCQKESCRKKYNKEWFIAHLKKEENVVVKCDACGSVVKPDIVFFGEKLSNRFFSSALTDFPKCDLLIIMGTSLVVQPFASLIHQVPKECPRLLINMVPVGTEMSGAFFNNGESGPLKYDQDDNQRDVFWQGKCDEGALKLAKILGWEDELRALAKRNTSG